MPNTVLIGSQWGDEGKGKVIDVLTAETDWVVRFQGGNNAGHTVEVGTEKYVLHLIPSGILHEGKSCVIGNGVVVDLLSLKEELDMVVARGVDPEGRFYISDRCQLVFPYHKALDGAKESLRSDDDRIGTTKRGIGPSYADKMHRTGLRGCDVLADDFEDRLRELFAVSNKMLEHMGVPQLDVEAEMVPYMKAANEMAKYIADTAVLIHDAMNAGQNVLFEGAQGTLLDIDHGTYPFVTSSNTTSGGACTGSGVAPNKIDRVIGVIKAYTTRVGEGPFTTELFDADGEALARVGHEFGATTGRPRRCGWFDAVIARYAVMINGISDWALTKLDVLDDMPVIKICVAYDLDGERLSSIPADVRKLARCTPIYEEMPGWMCSTREVTSYEDLPEKTRQYIERIEKLSGVKASILSFGPARSSTMVRS